MKSSLQIINLIGLAISLFCLSLTSCVDPEAQSQAYADDPEGIHLVLEAPFSDILTLFASTPLADDFKKALDETEKNQDKTVDSFLSTFFHVSNNHNLSIPQLFAGNNSILYFETPPTEKEIHSALVQAIEGSIESSKQIIKTRLEKFGIKYPYVKVEKGTNNILVSIPKVKNEYRLQQLLCTQAKLEFTFMYEREELFHILDKVVKVLPFEVIERDSTGSYLITDYVEEIPDDKVKTADYISVFAKLMNNFYPMMFHIKDTSKVNDYLSRNVVTQILPKDLRFAWSKKDITTDNQFELYGLKLKNGKPVLTGQFISEAKAAKDYNERPAILLKFNEQGSHIWQNITGRNIGKRIAVVLDNQVYLAPTIQSEIEGGHAIIQGEFTEEEAEDVATILHTGSLPVPLRIIITR